MGMLLAGAVTPAQACLNDRDTLAEEAEALPANTLGAITGRFPRNPPLFYEMRIQRESAQLVREPRNFNLYDDVAVAYDRSGRDRDALRWIEKKRIALPPFATVKNDAALREAWYRYYANVGTFRMHLWLHDGANRKNLAPVKQAISEITRTVQIKPNAHFGREKYQLKLMQWVLHPSKLSENGYMSDYLLLDEYADGSNFSQLSATKMPDALQGLSGLIMLGNAWESIDVFYALRMALGADGKNTLSYFASRRVDELIDGGKNSLNPHVKRGQALKKQMWKGAPPSAEENLRQLNELYTRLRTDANSYQVARTAYLLPRLQAGQHPDTDTHFWDGWHEPPAPSLERARNSQEWLEELLHGELGGILFLVAFPLSCVTAFLFLIKRRARRRAVAQTSHSEIATSDQLST